MGQQLEDNVAIVALIVSLIALVVTLNQFIVQLASTADGYRRCAESVIDCWHHKRKRKWKWSEFRFETQYVTPQIILISPQELKDYEEQYREVYLINSPKLDEKACKMLDDTVHQEYRQVGKRRLGHRWWKFPVLRSWMNKMMVKMIVKDVEKADKTTKTNTSRQRVRMRTESDPLVSWLRLLKELHHVSYSYWPEDCTTCDGQKWNKVYTGVVRTDYDSLRKQDHHDAFNRARTDIAVIYRTWTWDFMPPDMARPLAETNVGDIVIMAIRMGMQWRALEPEFGKMQADGNSYSLTATDVKGLGVVLRFISAGAHEWYPRIVPSQAADKLLLGIVPGDPHLVGRDFPMVNQDGQVQDAASFDGLFAKLGLPDARREEMKRNGHQEVKNDAIHLLLPFLPIEGSTITAYCTPVWHGTPGITGVHCFWEGRIALHRQLRERAYSDKIEPKLQSTLQEVLKCFDELESKHGDDWYSRFASSSSIRDGQPWDVKLACINDCRQVHNWTGKFLRDNGWAKECLAGHTKYIHLVAAHANVADHAMEELKHFLRNYPHDRAQPALKKAYGVGPEHGYYFVFEVYEMGLHYVKHMRDQGHGVNAYLRNKGFTVTDDEIEAAWWVAMLRGIVWNLSTHHPDNALPTILGQKLVPSSFYGNKSPVWIT